MRVMVLGGGSSQIEAFVRAKAEGWYTVLADIDPTAPARAFADAYAQVSTFDAVGVTEAARDYRVDVIVVVGTDQPVWTAAVASAQLGLPYPLTPTQAQMVTNKRIMKRVFQEEGLPTSPWAILGAEYNRWDAQGLDALRWPLVAKPVDSQGQRGVAIVRDRRALEAHWNEVQRFSREDVMLVEEYYPSKEVTLSGWMGAKDGCKIWAITDRVTIDPAEGSLGVCLGHRYPSAFVHRGKHSYEQDVRDLAQRVCRAFHLPEGPLYFQFLIGEQGVRLNEIAFRLGGAYEDRSIPLVTGIDPLGKQLSQLKRLIDPRIDDCVVYRTDGFRSRYFAVPLMFASPGRIARIGGIEALAALPGVAACGALQAEGTVIQPMRNASQRVAYAVLHATTPERLNHLVRTAFDTVTVEDEHGENLLIDAATNLTV